MINLFYLFYLFILFIYFIYFAKNIFLIKNFIYRHQIII
jgi:hypothetical protein